jgi:MFS family permease
MHAEEQAPTWARAVALATSALVIGALPLHLVGGLSVLIADEISFTKRDLGLAVSMYFAASAAFSLPAGWIAERHGYAHSLRGAAIVSGLAMVAIGGLATAWVHILAMLTVVGLAVAVTQVSTNVMLTRLVPRNRQGLAFGVKMAAIPASGALAGLSLSVVGLTVGWRLAYVGVAILAIGLVAFVPRGGSRPPAGLRGAGRPARRHLILLIAIGAGLGSAAGTTLTPFLVPYLVEQGYAPVVAGAALALGSATGILARIALGWLADRPGRGALLLAAGALLAGSVGYAVLAIAPHGLGLPVAIVLAFGGGFGWAGLLILAVSRASPEAVAKPLATLQMANFLGAIVGPFVFGSIADVDFTLAWVLLTVSAAAGAFVLLAGRRTLIADRQAPMETHVRTASSHPQSGSG